MGSSITLKNIPDAIYLRIKAAAKRHHRSMNSEIIACLEEALAPRPVDVDEHLARACNLRAQFNGPPLRVDDVIQSIDRHRD